MKHGCDNCKYRFFPVTRSPCDNCAMSGDKYSEWTAQTNADHIRSMTDAELAKWFCSMCNFGDFCPYQDDCDPNGSGILKWMKEEVSEI